MDNPNVWQDNSGLWHAKVPAADRYNTERDLAKALISNARDAEYLALYHRERTGVAAYNPAISLEQITEDYMSIWREDP